MAPLGIDYMWCPGTASEAVVSPLATQGITAHPEELPECKRLRGTTPKIALVSRGFFYRLQAGDYVETRRMVVVK